MEFVIIATPMLFLAIKRQMGPAVRPMNDIKNVKKKAQKLQLHHNGEVKPLG
jgi:hypothetical protein